MSRSNEVELAKIKAVSQFTESIISLFKHGITACFGYFSLKAIFDGLVPFLSAKPEVITAMTGFIEKLNFANITGYGLATVTTAAWGIERHGRKKAIKENEKLQEQIESVDTEPETNESSNFDNSQNEE